MKRLSLALMLAVLSISAMLAQRSVSGTVTDSRGVPLIGVSILAKGTTTGTITDVDGTYELRVPSGATILIFSYTGFGTQEITLGTSNSVNVSMVESAEQLSEVVVTGLGIRKEKKALGFGVSTIASADISLKSETDIGRILRGKATGVDVTQTSGLSGSGTNIIIRGYSSITGNNQPLFVVDGVAFNTQTNTDRGFATGGATASSRFLDLDPNNIAEITILKGLSATVLYGEAGRNGVILVTTKSGSAGVNADKKMEITLSQSVSMSEIANLPVYQNTYGNGFSGDFGWFFSNWGPAFTVRGSNGIDANGQVPHPYDKSLQRVHFPEFAGKLYDYKPYTAVEDFFQKGLMSNTSLSIDKALGTNGGVSANYSFLRDEGFIPADKNLFNKHNLGIGGRVNLANGINLKATLNIIASNRITPPASVGFGSDPSGASLFANLIYTPRSIDLLNLPYQSPLDGSQVYYRANNGIQNPLWTLHNASDLENVKRYFGTFEVSKELFKGLTALYRVGIDEYAQNTQRAINKGGSQVPNGELTTVDRVYSILDQVGNLMYHYDFNEDIDIDGIVGFNIRSANSSINSTSSTNQFVFDLLTHNNFVNHVGGSSKSQENTMGAYATATLGYKRWLYLNVQGRNDWTSTLEKANRSIFYPSASISVVPTDAIRSLQNNEMINFLKLRAGYGTSAGYPGPYQTRSVLGTATNVWLPASGGTALNTNSVSNRLGNTNLKPELHKELEFGLEGRFFKNRIGIDLSLYNKKSTDLIIDLDLDPATGYTNTTVNAAAITNKGIEASLNLTPVKGDFTWDLNLNWTKNKNIVDKIREGVDDILISGYTDEGNFAIPGRPYGVIKGSYYERHANGQRLINPGDGTYISSGAIKEVGDPNPDWTGNLINSFNYKGLSLSMHWSYISGGDILSMTTGTMYARGNTKDTDFDRFVPLVLPGVKADGTPNDIQNYAGDLWFNVYFFATEGLIFDATVVRLREIALAYELPKKWLQKSPFGSAFLRFSGENLFYKAPNFPKYINYDPEVLSLGVGNGRGMEYITAPTAKKYGVSLSVTF
jgi:TonB-linked SusC/RagA family outer membrane protein